jgi:hypothetical protein
MARKTRAAERWAAVRNARERIRFLHLGFNVLLVLRRRALNVQRAAQFYKHFQLKRLFRAIVWAVREEKCVNGEG